MGGVALAALAGASCDRQSGDGMSPAAQVYVAAIRDVLVASNRRPQDPDVLPVVYVLPVGESTIAADVQAAVVGELRDETEVRFADERSEALVEDAEHMPVRDDGVLLAVGELDPDGDPVASEVEVYRSDDDWSKALLTFAERSSHWTVTSSSVLPADGA